MAGNTATKSSFLYGLPKYDNEKTKDKSILDIKRVHNSVLEKRSHPESKDEKEDVIHRAIPVLTRSPNATLSYINNRNKSIQDAKHAFLSSTTAESKKGLPPLGRKVFAPKMSQSRNNGRITVANKSEDSRSTGGGACDRNDLASTNNKNSSFADSKNIEARPSFRRNQVQNRKVSFKTKNGSASHKRSIVTGKTTVTITNNKVAELTRKYNEMVVVANEREKESIMNQPKVARTIEKIQNSMHSPSDISTPSSTLSSGASIKIIVRQKKSSRSRYHRKRCWSVDSIDKIVFTDSPLRNRKVIRTKSDGSRKVKSPKKKPQPMDFTDEESIDAVDGISREPCCTDTTHNAFTEKTSVKNAIKKFECEMSTCRTKLSHEDPQKTDNLKSKPKVPEKKSSLIVTKNVVLKDGVPKIKTLRHSLSEGNVLNTFMPSNTSNVNGSQKNRDFLYDRKKYKTNYIHKDKLPLKLVEIIQEDVQDNVFAEQNENRKIYEEEKQYQDIAARITPNESFLWRRKSSCLSSYDTENVSEAHSYGAAIQMIINETDNIDLNNEEITTNPSPECDLSGISSVDESPILLDFNFSELNSILDLKVNEALNTEVIAKNTRASYADPEPEDDYEPFEILDERSAVVAIEPIHASKERQSSKINCPLPEIPKEPADAKVIVDTTDNVYQCLLEMRSHPEGDESSVHSYEICDNALEERTRGDGDSDDGYEYCKLPNSLGQENVLPEPHSDPKPLPPPPVIKSHSRINYELSNSISTDSTVSYEKIGSDAIYEKIPSLPKALKELPELPICTRDSIASSEYTSYNDGENIYDTIKQPDGISISNCYESIPNSPRGMIKLRNNFRKQISAVQKRLSFDSISNISRSTLSSEQKTNSIYGQRSIISFSGQEIAFQVPNSDTSVSDRSDRSEDWIDISDQEGDKSGDSKIIIVRERSRKSPISWSQKVRHQWHSSPKQRSIEDSSDSSHYYESLNLAEGSERSRTPRVAHSPRVPSPPYDDDFDSFDSDSDAEATQPGKNDSGVDLGHAKLPEPPSSSTHYTLTKFASAARRAAGKKMRELTRNFTKRHSDYGKNYPKTTPSNESESSKQTAKPAVYENLENFRPQESRIYVNLPTPEPKIYSPGLNKTDPPIFRLNGSAFNDELKEKINEKRLSTYGDIPPPLPDKPTTPTADLGKSKDKESGTLSRKTYFSFKSRFRRASSMAIDLNSDVPSALKITNSTFYLTDSMDGDSGFSNCSDNGQLTSGSAETLQPLRKRESGTRLSLPKHKYESSPELAAPPDERPPRLERPKAPPPPPPTDLTAVHAELKRLLPSLSKRDKCPRTRTSWYAGADCGQSETPSHAPPTASSWYAEVGLYQEGNVSTSSGASSSASPLPQHSRFVSEPLYQFYNAAKVESVCRENVADSDSDGYETVNEIKKAVSLQAGQTGSSAMWLLAAPRGPSRTLWCELPEVAESNLLNSLTPSQKRLQEAKFELVTSEASYLNSLSVLESHFICHPAFRDETVLSRTDREILFDAIIPVRKCSQLLMKELERCWKQSVLLGGLCELVRRHAEQHFHVYVQYCENQIFLIKTLQTLKTRPQFSEALATLESHPACQSLSLHSFLMLPMQRVTRLPLLMDAVLRNLDPADDEYQVCMDTLATLNNFVSQCNEGTRNMERIEEMSHLASCIEFPPHMRNAPDLAPERDGKPTRWLVRSGELTQLIWRGDEQLKLTFGKKFQKVPMWLFLFTDLLVITKKRSEEQYTVVDYCQRSLIEISAGDVMTQLNVKETPGKYVTLVTLLENYEKKTVEMLMSCTNETDASRWREALAPPGGAGGESVYAGWDCPQVAVLYTYAPTQPDELALAEGDIVNVMRKMPEGWYYGERIRDGETGWFPGSYTVEVASPHVRARNLRQRYRLLALSGSYLGQRKKT